MSAEGRALSSLDLPEKVREALREFLAKVEKALGEVEVYLFGSYARGDWLSDSDLDLVVVSEKFRGLSVGERYALVREMLPKDISVEILAYTPEEFERALKRSVILRDAAEYWVKLL